MAQWLSASAWDWASNHSVTATECLLQSYHIFKTISLTFEHSWIQLSLKSKGPCSGRFKTYHRNNGCKAGIQCRWNGSPLQAIMHTDILTLITPCQSTKFLWGSDETWEICNHPNMINDCSYPILHVMALNFLVVTVKGPERLERFSFFKKKKNYCTFCDTS